MGIYVYAALYTILYVLLCRMFVEVFEEKRRLRRKASECGVLICFMALDVAVSIAFDSQLVIKEVIIVALGACFMWICFRQTIMKALILVLMYQGICFMIDYSVIIIMSKCFPVITMEQLSETSVCAMLGVLSQMLLACFLMLLRRYAVKKSSEMLTTAEWARFTVFPLFTIVVLVALLAGFEIPQGENEKNLLICIVSGLLVMNLMVFYLINDILKREAQIRTDRILLERVKNETEMYRTVSENYDRQRKREHEYKNQLALIAALAREHKTDEISRYLKRCNDEILAHTNVIDTNHVIVNAILNAKYQETKEKGILFVVKVNDLSGLEIKDEDLVLILSNLLNNAIEASEASDTGVIRLKLVREQGQIIISVVNTYSREPQKKGDKFLTTKSMDAGLHGIGIGNIKEAVEKYGGSCVIKYDKDSFRFAIMIPD